MTREELSKQLTSIIIQVATLFGSEKYGIQGELTAEDRERLPATLFRCGDLAVDALGAADWLLTSSDTEDLVSPEEFLASLTSTEAT